MVLKATVNLQFQAYVTQDDNLIGTLTVRETISYSARLRLPDKMPREEKQALVEGTIIEMGLQDCADTVVGNWHLRGISGGEKRRVSIALEILMRPRLLFLDEPTSGLDRYVLLHLPWYLSSAKVTDLQPQKNCAVLQRSSLHRRCVGWPGMAGQSSLRCISRAVRCSPSLTVCIFYQGGKLSTLGRPLRHVR